jgi:hypothetical protein
MAMVLVCPPEQGRFLEGLWAASLPVVSPQVQASKQVSWAWVLVVGHASVYPVLQDLLRPRRLV